MTTIPTQATASDLEIVKPRPNTTDAQLLMQHMQLHTASGASFGWTWLMAFETPPTLAQLRKRHPLGSIEYQQVQALLDSCELLSTLVKHGLINETLVLDTYWVEGVWNLSEKVCKGLRREAHEPRLLENFEALAQRAKQPTL